MIILLASLKVAYGGYLEVLGYMVVPMTFRSQTIEMPNVIEIVQNLILGFDFSKKDGLQIVDVEGLEVAAIITNKDQKVNIEAEIEHQCRDRQARCQIVQTFLITTDDFLDRTHN